ncbi:hypothetical protein [uncultured Maribacter sp.]|uniref:hypothetical protein n=1 Tax=uncultured Maribacter sp. TaxID=431308 RepID=UPI0026051F3D|nr:hypothetical protein [uncultured Maribacter sp.]
MDLKVFFSIVFILTLLACDNRSPKEKFDKFVFDEYHSKYDGIVVEKYFDKKDHNRHIIQIEHKTFGINKKDFTFQSLQLFDFIKVGDTLLKDNKSIKLRIKRINLDTVIPLDFGNVKGVDLYYWENQYVKQEFNIDD